ncbi:RAF2 [Auxenochlorella protothecoides x Auxenochlorella symbiontica]
MNMLASGATTRGLPCPTRPLVSLSCGRLGVSFVYRRFSMSSQKLRARDADGDFGARDPFPGEIATNFTEKSFGNENTEHLIKPPDGLASLVGLKNRKCLACEGGDVKPLTDSEAEKLRHQCPGWRLTTNDKGIKCISQEWKVRNFMAGLELFKRVAAVAEAEGHHPDLHLVGYNRVTAELTTHSANGLTENDFIMAAKISDLDVADLQPKRKPKFWA